MGFFRDGVDGKRGRRYDMLFWQSVGFFFCTTGLPGGEKYSCIRAGLNHREAALSEF